jgi:Na+/alanine symporter
VLNTGTVWQLSETVNGLMAIPNLIALTALTPELCRLLRTERK